MVRTLPDPLRLLVSGRVPRIDIDSLPSCNAKSRARRDRSSHLGRRVPWSSSQAQFRFVNCGRWCVVQVLACTTVSTTVTTMHSPNSPLLELLRQPSHGGLGSGPYRPPQTEWLWRRLPAAMATSQSIRRHALVPVAAKRAIDAKKKRVTRQRRQEIRNVGGWTAFFFFFSPSSSMFRSVS